MITMKFSSLCLTILSVFILTHGNSVFAQNGHKLRQPAENQLRLTLYKFLDCHTLETGPFSYHGLFRKHPPHTSLIPYSAVFRSNNCGQQTQRIKLSLISHCTCAPISYRLYDSLGNRRSDKAIVGNLAALRPGPSSLLYFRFGCKSRRRIQEVLRRDPRAYIVIESF